MKINDIDLNVYDENAQAIFNSKLGELRSVVLSTSTTIKNLTRKKKRVEEGFGW